MSHHVKLDLLKADTMGEVDWFDRTPGANDQAGTQLGWLEMSNFTCFIGAYIILSYTNFLRSFHILEFWIAYFFRKTF